MAAVRNGCPDSLGTVYRCHAPAVYGAALKVLRDQARAEDVTQTVFLAIWEAPDRYDPARGSLRALLVSMSHNRSIDVVRSEESRRLREDGSVVVAAEPSDLAVVVERLDVADRVRTAVASLDATTQQALALAYFGGRTYRQVARELDVSEGTIKARIRRGLETLRSLLASEDLR